MACMLSTASVCAQNAKELSESFGCFNAARTQLSEHFKPDDPRCFGWSKCNVLQWSGMCAEGAESADTHLPPLPMPHSVLLVAVGDGLTPRTAALFAFRTQWTCVAINPLMVEPEAWAGKVTAERSRRRQMGVGRSRQDQISCGRVWR